MEIVFLKLLCTVVLFVVMTTCGLIPVVAVRKCWSTNFSESTSTVISICNCLAGGVFVGMCFLGLFPYVREKFDEILESADLRISFPLTEFVVLLGFFIFLAIEQSLLVLQAKKDSRGSISKKISLKMSEVEESEFVEEEKKSEDESRIRLLEPGTPETGLCFDPKSKEENLNAILKTGKQTFDKKEYFSDPQQSGKCSAHRAYSGFVGHNHCNEVYVFQKDSTMRNIIFLFAMSIHTLFEGMALGLQTDTVKVFHLFLAILIHESLVIFALGINVAKFNFGLATSLKYIVLVTASIPVGIIFGMLCGAAPGMYGKIVSGFLQGLCAGIFIHVTFMELIPEEFFSSTNRLYKVLFFFIGFMCMSIVTFSLDGLH